MSKRFSTGCYASATKNQQLSHGSCRNRLDIRLDMQLNRQVVSIEILLIQWLNRLDMLKKAGKKDVNRLDIRLDIIFKSAHRNT
jgi:hypothetical protein